MTELMGEVAPAQAGEADLEPWVTALPFSGAQNGSLNPTATPSSSSAHRLPAYGLSCLSMGLGVVSNLTGLAVLATSYRRRRGHRRRTKAPFLLLASALLLSDLAGQVIPGALALYLHLEQRRRPPPLPGQRFEPSQPVCQLFGACMVFFGLCPLLLGSTMAMERCLGITTPFLHARLATATHVRLAVLLVGALALSLAALPLLGLGDYVPQHPGTWCFLPVHASGGGGGGGQHQRLTPAHATLALTFSSLGLAALLLSVLCNSVSGVTLLRARQRCGGARSSVTTTTTTVTITTASVSAAKRHRGPPSASCLVGIRSLDLEMMAQLVVINVVSCVCWCPFLISISLSVGESLVMGSSPPPPLVVQRQERRLLLSLRLASWNQILDPWVYILLRRAVLRRACCCCCWLGPGQNHRPTLSLRSSSTESHRQDADRN